MPMSRSRWYSRSVSVSAGATVIESPVCTPIGSTFSIEQTTTTLSARVAHQLELVLLPAEDRLLEQHLGGRRVVQARAGDAAQVGLVVREARAEAAHRERRPHDDRVAQVLGDGEARPRSCARSALRADSAPQPLDDALERSGGPRPCWIASTFAPMSSTSYFSRTPASCSAIAALSAVWPPRVGSIASGRSLAMIVSTTSGVIGST